MEIISPDKIFLHSFLSASKFIVLDSITFSPPKMRPGMLVTNFTFINKMVRMRIKIC